MYGQRYYIVNVRTVLNILNNRFIVNLTRKQARNLGSVGEMRKEGSAESQGARRHLISQVLKEYVM